ncbi:MAG: VWA domain-containing protein [Polyangiaceae bacterium]
MRFAEPFWLLVGALVVGLLFVLRARSERLTMRAMAALAGARLVNASALPSRVRRWLRIAVTCFAVAMGFVALARPQKGMQWQTLDREGTDLVLVVDTSKSMNADDVAPTRLERAKLAIRDLVERFPGDRIGLVAFAGDAFVESPMTLDHDALLETLAAFDTSVIGRGGTDMGRAIDVASAALKSEAGDQKVMVLLTDGEDLESQGQDAAKRAAEAGITIDTVGVGTAAGELVPAKNDQGATVGLMRDENGAPVRSRLDEAGLRAIAQATHGTYRPLGEDGRGLDRLYAESLAPLSHTERSARVRRVYAEWFALPLALSIFGIVLDSLLGWRGRRPRPRAPTSRSPGPRPAHLAAPAAVALFLLLLPASAHASVQDAEKAYAAGRFDSSAREYEAEHARHPKDPRLSVDAGAAAYRAGHYDAAETAFGQALSTADPKLQQRVFYDLGDARYRLGAATLSDAPEKTIERWKAAIDAYQGALALAPSDKDAAYNRDFVKRKLSELENKQNENKQNENKRNENKQNENEQNENKQNENKQPSKNEGAGRDAAKDSAANAGGSHEPSSGSPKDGQSKSAENGAETQSPSGTKPGTAADKAARANSARPGGEPAKPGGQNGAADDAAGRRDGAESGVAAGGPLSPRDARALLDSLRNDDRRGASFGSSAASAGTEPPRKDW